MFAPRSAKTSVWGTGRGRVSTSRFQLLALALALAGAACSSDKVPSPPPVGVDFATVPRIRFNLQPPQNLGDYPYTTDVLPPERPAPHSNVYLSAADSLAPAGRMIAFFWNVQDPTGQYLDLGDPAAVRTSFSPSLVGLHVITLEVIEVGGLHQITQTMVTISVTPRACARDGFSAPCSDELAVPGGTFLAGSADDTGFGEERPRHTATVAPFMMDKYEVTVGRFRRYFASYTGADIPEGAGAHPLIPGSGWQPGWNGFKILITECGGAWTDEVGPSEARPIGCITWYEALAFCIWEGKRLPTETEWEYAAAGGSEQRTYPWGNDAPSRDRAVYGCLFDGQPGCSDADLPVVGSVAGGAGRWGHLDLAGSLFEWTFDAYAPYGGSTCDNCANLNVNRDDDRVFRSGDYALLDPGSLRAAARYGFDGKFPDPYRGFRCARSLPPTPP